MSKYKFDEPLTINADVVFKADGRSYSDSVVVALSSGGAWFEVPIDILKRVHPEISRGLVIKFNSGYLAGYVAMRTREKWHFDVDSEAIWTDEGIIREMDRYGYDVIYNPKEEK